MATVSDPQMRRYLDLFRPHRATLAFAGVLLIVNAALPAVAVLWCRLAVDEVLAGGGDVLVLAVALALTATAESILQVLRTRLTKRVAFAVSSTMRRRVHRQLLTLPPARQEGTGARLASLTHDVDELQYGVSALLTACRDPLTLVGLVAAGIAVAPRLAVLAGLLLPGIGLVAWLGGRLLRRRAAAWSTARARLVGLAQEQLAGLRTVQSYAAEEDEHARFVVLDEEDRAARLALEADRLLPSAATRTLAGVALAGLLVLGGRQVASGAIAPSALVAFVAALGLMRRPLSGLGEVWSLLQRSLTALERIEGILTLRDPLAGPAVPRPVPPTPMGLRWRGVTVDHGAGAVLRDVDLEARPGEILALTGPSGAGKSSLLALAQRMLDPVSGVVEVNGIDVRHVDPRVLRRSIVQVRQDVFLFARSIRDNVTLGWPGAPDDAVRAALDHAQMMEFVDALPNGMDTPLDELGARLSGGERQRIALARGWVLDGPILMLDEPTSHLDEATARIVTARIAALRGRRTVVVVAHDPALTAIADRVAVVTNGRVEVGVAVATGQDVSPPCRSHR